SLTVQAVLELDEVKAGEPELLSGAERLATPVRWVHIADTGRVGSLLEGGELVLSTGQPFRDSVADARAFLEDLERAGAAGAVIELVDERGEPADAAIAVLRRAAHGCRMAVAV